MRHLTLAVCCFCLELLRRCVQALVSAKSSLKNDKKVIVFVIDGLANWILNAELNNPATNTAGFEKLIKNGVQADYLLPEFPTVSYPNLYSMVTGLYPGTHGVIGNYMYDRYRRKYFGNLQTKSDLDLHWWNSTEPVWMSATRQNIRTAMYWWPGCEVNFQGANISSTCIQRFHRTSSLSKNLLKEIPNIIQRITQEHLKLVFIYYGAVKTASRKHGPASGESKSKVEDVSRILFTLQHALEAYDLFQSVNLLVLSTHGMSPVTLENSLYFLDDYVDNMDMVDVIIDNGSRMLIFPKTGREYQVYQKVSEIPHSKLFWKDKLLTRWHLKGAKLLPSIVLLCDPGYGVYCRNCRGKLFPKVVGDVRDGLFKGDSGYDNAAQQMHGVFLARGSDFRSNHRHSWLRMVDVYQMICDTVKITCHENNGSWDRVLRMLSCSFVSSLSMWALSIPILFTIFKLFSA